MKPIWFKAKHYGWGWYPATWQGWTIMLAYVVAVIWLARDADAQSLSVSDTLIGLVPMLALLTIALLVVCYVTGETPRWRWGKKDGK